jgi:hypothetical protein
VASPPGGLSQETGLTKNAPGPSAPLSHPRFIAAVCHRFFASCGKHLAFSLNWNDSASFLLPALRHASTIVVNLVGGRRATGAHRLLAWQPCLAHLGRARRHCSQVQSKRKTCSENRCAPGRLQLCYPQPNRRICSSLRLPNVNMPVRPKRIGANPGPESMRVDRRCHGDGAGPGPASSACSVRLRSSIWIWLFSSTERTADGGGQILFDQSQERGPRATGDGGKPAYVLVGPALMHLRQERRQRCSRPALSPMQIAPALLTLRRDGVRHPNR